MKNIATIALTITASILLNSLPSKAEEVNLLIPTENQFKQYERMLAYFFLSTEDDAVYNRKSKEQIRIDGQDACNLLEVFTVENYILVMLNKINKETSSIAERKAQYAYLIYGTAASVSAICSKYKESFLNLTQRVKKHGFNHYLLDQ
jgi:hypothetical protein